MQALVLAAGYATRLRPLTDSVAKPLLPLAGRPMLDYLADKIDDVRDVDELHVVTNDRYAGEFAAWAAAREGRLPPVVHNDGTRSNEDRLGAIGDIAFVVDRAGLRDVDLLVVAGDNLFEAGLGDFVDFWRGKGDGSALAVHDVGDRELARQYGIVEVAADDRVVAFVEKPDDPPSTLAATATYVYHREHVPLVREYLDGGNSPDQPGNFVAWLHTRAPVYGYRLGGEWLDIGDREQLLEADNRMRARNGLPQRDEYALA